MPHINKIKMSEVITDFAEPPLKVAVDNNSVKAAISVAVIGWNLSLASKVDQDKMIKEVVYQTSETEEDICISESIIRMLLARKETFFPHIKKLVVNHDIQFVEGRMVLNVVSTQI